MKVKCYAIYQSEKQIISEYSNPSQKSFLDYELTSEVKRILKSRPSNSIEYQATSNGVWYSKTYPAPPSNSRIHLILISQQFANISLATSLITKGFEIQGKSFPIDKIRMKIAEVIKMYNANDSRFNKLNNSVTQLEGIMKNNVGRIVDNISDLGSVERKSEMMTNLSMQFQRDSKALEEKMKRRKFITKLIIAGVVILILAIVIYILFG